jgi:hypothetical protein
MQKILALILISSPFLAATGLELKAWYGEPKKNGAMETLGGESEFDLLDKPTGANVPDNESPPRHQVKFDLE